MQRSSSGVRHVKEEFILPGCCHEAFETEAPTRLLKSARLLGLYGAFALFAVVGVITSLLSLPPSLILRPSLTSKWGQRLIHRLFRFFVWYLETCGLVRLDAGELRTLLRKDHCILAANHPSLLDAVFVTAMSPNLFCVMKSAVLGNLILCGQARLAGYVANDCSLGFIKNCRSRLQEGSHLLIFPEGTRTDRQLGPFKNGFALLSHLTGLPVQTVLIRYDTNFLGKGWPLFRPPPLPLRCSLRLGKRFSPDSTSNHRDLGKRIESYFQETLAR